MLRRLLLAWAGWLGKRADARELVRMRAACPIGARVRLTGACGCARRYRGQLGTVRGLSSFAPDYDDWRIDVDGVQGYELICPRGVEVIAS